MARVLEDRYEGANVLDLDLPPETLANLALVTHMSSCGLSALAVSWLERGGSIAAYTRAVNSPRPITAKNWHAELVHGGLPTAS